MFELNENRDEFFAEEPAETSLEQLDETIDDTEESSEILVGVVIDCSQLNIRKNPSIAADVVCKVVAGSELLIDESKSTDEWYGVCTEVGVEGFCMRKYVNIK